ncbi:MAG TPA: tetratricopeptide repeat protein, partial [Acidimicrobiales bacterium]
LGDHRGEAEALSMRGMTSLFAGEANEAEASIRQALDVFRSLGDTRDEAWALWNLAWISFEEGRLVQAEERLEKSARAFTEARDWGGLSWAHGLLGFVKYFQGDRAEAERIALRVIDGVAESGDRWAYGMVLVLLAGVRLWEGRTAEAVEPARDAVEQFTGMSDIRGQGLSYATLARALAASGRVREAMAVLDRADQELPEKMLMPVATFARAATALHIGDPAMAQAALAGWTTDESFAGDMTQAEGQILLGVGLLQTGKAAKALRAVEAALANASSDGTRANALALLALASAADGRPSAAVETADEVFAIPVATYLDRTTALVARGCALVQAGDEGGMRAAFDEAERIIDGTSDRVSQATVRLARGRALEQLGSADAVGVLQTARTRLDAMGLAADGWDTAFRLACGAGTPSPSPVADQA